MAAGKGGGKCPRSDRLRRGYGITADQYDALLRSQRGRCAICERLPKKIRLAVDHDHGTGFVRGLLCSSCNRAIAAFRDSQSLLNAAERYLHAADDAFESLDLDEQDEWLPFKGRANGKLRRKRITKTKPKPRLPQVEEDLI